MVGKTKQEENTLGMLAHLLGLFTGFIAPLIIYLLAEDKKLAKENARHALNFQISLIIYWIISFVLVFLIVGIFLMIAIGIFELIVVIIACIKASAGEIYQYPLEIQFIKRN